MVDIQARCRPPKDDREVHATVEWACDQERGMSRSSPVANWRDQLIVNQNRNPKPILANAMTALRFAPEWCDVLAFNEFSLETVALKPPPWNKAATSLDVNHRKTSLGFRISHGHWPIVGLRTTRQLTNSTLANHASVGP